MTLEELQVKVAELTESLAAQSEANNGLKADLTKAKAELRKGQAIDPAEFSALQSENEALKGKMTAYEKDIKKVASERDQALKTLENESQVTVNMQRERDLTEALSAAGVTNSINLKAAKAILAAQVQVVTDGDKRITKVGDKSLSDYLTEWKATDEGRHFISAPVNSGGGAQGSGNGGGAKTMTRASYNTLSASNPAQAAEFFKGGGQLTD